MANMVPVLRWVLAFPLAIATATVVQIGIGAAVAYGMQWSGAQHGSVLWLGKCVAAFLIGASLVTVATLIAPNRKNIAAAAALGLVLLWGATLIVGSFSPQFFVWSFAMGLLGLVGGVGAFTFVREASQQRTAV